MNLPEPTTETPPAARTAGRARRGFSLIEVLLAMAILTIGILSVASLFPVAAAQQRRAIDDTQGVIIGRNVLSLLRVRGTNFLGLTGTNSYYITLTTNIPGPNNIYTDPGGTYQYSVAARWRNANAPVDVAVFVYRTAGAKPVSFYDGRIDSYTPGAIVPAPINITTGAMDPVAGVAGRDSTYTDAAGHHIFRPGDRNQLILYAANSDTTPPFVTRVVKDNTVEVPPLIDGSVVGTQIMSLPQRAVAIVTGTVQ